MTPESIFAGPEGSTPIEEDQRPFLVNSAISTRGELDSAEQSNMGITPREIPFKIGEKKFTWGSSTYSDRKILRGAYLSALRTADSQFQYQPLLDFARS